MDSADLWKVKTGKVCRQGIIYDSKEIQVYSQIWEFTRIFQLPKHLVARKSLTWVSRDLWLADLKRWKAAETCSIRWIKQELFFLDEGAGRSYAVHLYQVLRSLLLLFRNLQSNHYFSLFFHYSTCLAAECEVRICTRLGNMVQ